MEIPHLYLNKMENKPVALELLPGKATTFMSTILVAAKQVCLGKAEVPGHCLQVLCHFAYGKGKR